MTPAQRRAVNRQNAQKSTGPKSAEGKARARQNALKHASRREGLNILQHPEGQPMKVSICSNAVTGVDPQRGLVQYVTLARGGSSGSPCFDDEWGVVALHHAQRSRAFGSIREGVLLEAIHREIGPHLND